MEEWGKNIVATSWSGRAFKALDFENRGFLYKHEILNHIYAGGVDSLSQLRTLV